MYYKLKKQNRLLPTIYTSSLKNKLYQGKVVTFRNLRQSDDVEKL